MILRSRHLGHGRDRVNATPGTKGFYEKPGFGVSGEMHVRNGHPAIPMMLGPSA